MAPKPPRRWQRASCMAGLGMALVYVCASYTTTRAISGIQRFARVLEAVSPSSSRQLSDDFFPPVLELAAAVDADDGDEYGYYVFNSRGVIRRGRKRVIEWVDMDLADVPSHFTKAELDSLGFDYDADLGPQANVSSIFGGERLCSGDAGCCLGSKSAGGQVFWRDSVCKGEVLGRKYFRRYLPAAGEPSRDLHRMPDVLRRLGNRTLTFVGDSISVQVATGAQCDWTRHSVPMANVLLADPTRSAAVELQKGAVISRGVSSRTYFPPPEHLPPNTPPDSWVFGMTEEKHSLELEGTMSTVKNVRMYKPVPDMSNVLEQVETSDAVILNFGLHMGAPEDMANTSRGLLEALLPYATRRDKVVMWRETSAQHHFTDGGEWPPDPSTYPGIDLDAAAMQFSKHECKPHAFRNASVLRMWRDRVVYKTALDLGYTLIRMDHQDDEEMWEGPEGPRLYILPFFEATAGLWDHHDATLGEEGSWHCEATHFCHTPYVWEHVYDAAYRALATAGF